jgi:thioredoxin reductase
VSTAARGCTSDGVDHDSSESGDPLTPHPDPPAVYDVVIVGGSYAGMAAALQLGRARREVLIVDAGRRRNRDVAHAHGILGHDGASPAAVWTGAKAEVLRYPTIHWRDARVSAARVAPGGFAVEAGDQTHAARRLVLAHGLVDEVPAIPGVRERWAKTVFHCPYCDGYELDRGRLGVLASGPNAAHYASLVAEWGLPGQTVLFVDAGGAGPDPSEMASLAGRRIQVEPQPVLEARDAPAGIELLVQGGGRYALAALFAMPHTSLPGDFVRQLGCEVDSVPTGSIYKTDARTKETTVAGVFACGDAALAQHSVTYAVADGARAGISAHQSLVFAHPSS